MKNYMARLRANAKPIEFIWWWILRAAMLFGIIDSIFFKKDLTQVAQMSANLVGMFAWEICMATSERNFMRYLPAYIQDVTAFGFFLASFGGAYLNLYYIFPYYDLIFHIFGGMAGALFGYEALTAMQIRDKVKCHVPFVILAAFGFSFICGNAWELFEFFADQFVGTDAQHWSKEIADAEALLHNNPKLSNPHIIPELDPTRWALMDTMEDLVCNTIGGVIVYVWLLIYPYHHKGKHNVNESFTDEFKKETAKK